MAIFYAAVEDDPLDSGKGSYVLASVRVGTVKGEDGRDRRLVFVGDSAWCERCKTMGVITGGAPVPDRRRLLDVVNGMRRQAVGGDMVVCKCEQHPRIIAVNGRKFTITVDGDGAKVLSRNAPRSAPSVYDEQFTLLDSYTGQPLSGVRYRVHVAFGKVYAGVTDAQGRTERVSSENAHALRLEVRGV
ncbi:hypothetical protein P3T23_002340 [Paraburkholderia sp. GAS448]|uniref:hypothetical protein n=1 Tax=Paraburkholderia sp. GAS448 TaxID=3035136 RepID=UPI003D1DCF2A